MSPRTRSTPFEASGPNTTVPGLQHSKPRHLPQAMDVPRFPLSSTQDDAGFSEANFSLYSHLPIRNPQQQAAVASWIDTTGEADFDPSPYLTEEALSYSDCQGQQPATTSGPFSSQSMGYQEEIARRLSSAASTFDLGEYSQPMSSNLHSSPYQHGVPFLSHESSMSCSEGLDPTTLSAFDDPSHRMEPENAMFTSPVEQFSQSFPADDFLASDLTFEAGHPQDLFSGSSSGESSYPSPPGDEATLWSAGPMQPQPCRTFSVPMHTGNPANRQLISPPLSEPNGNATVVPSTASCGPFSENQYQSLATTYTQYGQPVTFCDPVTSLPTAHSDNR